MQNAPKRQNSTFTRRRTEVAYKKRGGIIDEACCFDSWEIGRALTEDQESRPNGARLKILNQEIVVILLICCQVLGA